MQSVLGKVIGPKEVHPENLDGKVAVVTGGALGIGYVRIHTLRSNYSTTTQI